MNQPMQSRVRRTNHLAYVAGYLESAATLIDVVADDFKDPISPAHNAAFADLAEARARLDRVAQLVFPCPAFVLPYGCAHG